MNVPDQRLMDAFGRARLNHHHEVIGSAVGASMLIGVALVALLWKHAPHALLLGWLSALAVVLMLRVAIDRAARRANGADARHAHWLLCIRCAYGVHGLVWAGAVLLLGGRLEQQPLYLLVFAVAAIAAGSVVATAFDLVAAALFAVASLAPLLLLLFAAGDSGNPALGTAVLLVMLAMAGSARRNGRMADEAVRLQLEAAGRADESLRHAAAADDARRQLADQHQLLTQLLQSTQQGCWFIDNAALTTDVNPAMCELLGRPREQILGRSAFEFFSGADLATLRREVAALDEGRRGGYEVDIVRPDGTRRRGHNNATPIYDATGLRVGSVGLWTDLTDHLQTETALRTYELVTNAITDMVSVIGEDRVYRMVNDAWVRGTGVARESAVGGIAPEVLPTVITTERAAALADCLRLRQVRTVCAPVDVPALRGRILETSYFPYGMDMTGVPCAVLVSRDVTEREQGREALTVARDDAERANAAKSRFLSQMSHELRTPLNAILGFAQLLGDDRRVPLAEAQRVHVAEILRGGRHLLALVNELLDLGRIEADQLSLKPVPVALGPLVAECLALMLPLARQHGVHLLPPAGLHGAAAVLADAMRLRQVLLNLLGNAIKYNRPGGEVEVLCGRDGAQWVLTVRDSGAGIDAAALERLFRPFERLEAGRTAIEGTGIGLALSRRLVDAMGGSIGVDSQPGVGSRFWVRLPEAGPAPHTPLPEHVSSPVNSPLNLPVNSPLMAPATAPGGPERPLPVLPATALYIEDNPVNALLMEIMLEDVPGLRLLQASLPTEGLEIVRRERVDLVLLDIQMPEMDGFEVLARLRADPRTRALPIIAVSANARPEDIALAHAAGFDGYLTKPVELDLLLRTVRAALAGAAGA